jgi:hypothetical protein
MSDPKSDDTPTEVQAQDAVPPLTAASKQDDEITRTEPIELGILSKTQNASIEAQPATSTAEEPPSRRHLSGWRLYVLTFG